MALAAVLAMGSFSAADAAQQKPGLLTRTLDRVHGWNQNRLRVKAANQEFADLVKDPTVQGLYKAAKSEQHTGWLQTARVLHFANVGVQTFIGLHAPVLSWLNGAAILWSMQKSWALTKQIGDAGLSARSKTVARAMDAGRKVGQAKLRRLHDAGVIDMKQVQAAKAKPARAKKTAQARRARG
jgi:hypothetical protein